MKGFYEVLNDCFKHVTEITDQDLLRTLRSEGVRIDDEGYHTFAFGENNEFEYCVEPIGDEGNFLLALYKNRVTLIHKLPIWVKQKDPSLK